MPEFSEKEIKLLKQVAEATDRENNRSAVSESVDDLAWKLFDVGVQLKGIVVDKKGGYFHRFPAYLFVDNFKHTFTTSNGDVAILHSDYIKPEHVISEEEICKAHQEQK